MVEEIEENSKSTPTTEQAKQPPKSILWPVLIAAMTTAALVGGFKYVAHAQEVKQQLADMQTQMQVQSLIIPEQEVEALLATIPVASSPADSDASPDNWIYGHPNARFTLVEMTDTECPYCRQHIPVIKTLIESSASNINGALLHVPVQGEASRRQAVAIECAGEQGGSDAAWKFLLTVMERTRGNGSGVVTPMVSIANEHGLDTQRFSACLDSVEVIDRVMADLDNAVELQIAQTPSTLIFDNQSGKSILLQGGYASADGIINAIETLTQETRP